MPTDDAYLFYELMHYPRPFNVGIFSYWGDADWSVAFEERELSRAKPGPYLEEFLQRIKTYRRLYRTLPFVDRIYLANSITFNALHEWSDIDLFFVIKDGRLWTARFFSVLLFFVCGVKRFSRRTHKKFCLSFYVTESATNLLPLKLQPHDPYLVYRLAHLVPLYDESWDRADEIYKKNQWVNDYLPNFPQKQSIFLGGETYRGTNATKRFLEKTLGGAFGDLIEMIIKFLRLPILLWKKRRLWPVGEDIIISDKILKFHADKRRMIATKWKVAHNKEK